MEVVRYRGFTVYTYIVYLILLLLHSLIKRRKLQSQTNIVPHCTVPCSILVMMKARLIGDKYKLLSHQFQLARF